MKLLNTIIRWHISLAVAAVFLTLSAQIQLGMKPQLQPYLILIFLSTLFEYNRHSIVILFFPGEALHSGKHELIRKKHKIFFLTALILGIGFIASALSTKTEVLLAFFLLGFLTFFYSGLGFGNKNHHYKLREIPYLKIILITSIWSVSTILLPVIQSGNEILNTRVILLFTERFLFIFAIAIQFDIRDMQADRDAGLKTIPLLIGFGKATIISYLSLLTCFFISFLHYRLQNQWFVIIALFISLSATYLFIKLNLYLKLNRYYYQILDATLLLQGMLVLGFYFLNRC